MNLPPQAVAAIWGAGAGTLSTILIKSAGWFFARRRRRRTIKVALYHEVFRHSIFELGMSSEGPDLRLVGFARAAYDAYLSDIPDLLDDDLVAVISQYYANVTAASSLLNLMERDAAEARDTAAEAVRIQARSNITHPVHPAELEILKSKGQQVHDRLKDTVMQTRFLLVAAMAQRERLLNELRKVFNRDPAQEPVQVPEQYEDWFEKAAAARLKNR